MGAFANELVEVTRRLIGRNVTPQAGILAGQNPVAYNASDPTRLWVIQVVIIVVLTQFLSLLLSRIRQPRVIAEVIGGVLLGPTVMGRIPGFSSNIFPTAGMPLLSLTSTIGLVLFLFLVGLEIDTRVIKRNIRASSIISVAGLVVPLGLGAGLGVGIYHEFIADTVNFGYFLLFVAVAVGITAFPVLCRILTELKLLDTTVGIVVLSAGVGNDVVGWILLALTVALVNASTGLTALYVLLVSVGYVIFLLYPVKMAYRWLAIRTGSLERGSPTGLVMTVTLLMVFISAFFTDVIGVHAIFGGFLAGLVVPHDNGFAISLVEKLEDLVSIIFLPIYFTLSGLNTNLGLLNNGITWGYTILICTVSFSAKFLACSASAKAAGFNWRESGAIGSLMSCKGLVELIVLNVGLSAGVLNTRVFSMFVVHAIVLTFLTTPLTLLFYPPKYRIREPTTTPGGGAHRSGGTEDGRGRKASDDSFKTKFAIVLDKMEQLPAAMTLSQLLQPPLPSPGSSTMSIDEKTSEIVPVLSHTPTSSPRRISFDALRLIELTNRTSAVLKSQEADTLIYNDPIISVFRTFGYLNRFIVSAALSVVTQDEFPAVVSNHIVESESQMVLLPWCRAVSPESEVESTKPSSNPFEGMFTRTPSVDHSTSIVYSEFIRKVFQSSPVDVGLFVDRGICANVPFYGPGDQHIFLPFFGGPDDRLALSFVIQLCANPNISAMVIRIVKTEVDELSPASTIAEAKAFELPATNPRFATPHNTVAGPDTVYGQQDTHTRMASDTADNLAWDRYTRAPESNSPAVTAALTRITFSTRRTPQPLHTVLEMVQGEVAAATGSRNLLIALGRSRRMAVESHQTELQHIVAERSASMGSSVPKTLGDVGAALVMAGTNASLLVMQTQCV